MPLNSTDYLVFLGIAVVLYWSIPARMRVSFLLLSGMTYYLYAGAKDFALLVAVGLYTFLCARYLLRQSRRSQLLLTVSVLILLLAFFKYVHALMLILQSYGTNVFSFTEIALPLGISFYIFECMHYLIESYKGVIKEHRITTFFAFLFFFPTRMSGPIKRYPSFASQQKDIMWDARVIGTGLALMVLGYAQKIVIADPLVRMTSDLFFPEVFPHAGAALFALYAYAIRIYADFAGLSNIAIGSALLFGIRVPINFKYPYLQPNIALFWRRWHMSLSNWVRDYLYIPLGGSRVGPVRLYMNLIIIMFVIGIWHGSTLNFAVWGLYHGLGLAAHRFWTSMTGGKSRFGLPGRIGSILLTFHFVTFGWLFFATTSMEQSLRILALFVPW